MLPYPSAEPTAKKTKTRKPSAAKGYFVLTCNEAYNAKVQAKEQKEQQEIEKAERKRKREEKAKNGKKEKQKKMEARGKPDTETTWECFICTLPGADGDEDFIPMVFCNGCGRWLHIGCIPMSHSMPISDDENEPYYCHECSSSSRLGRTD